MTSPYIVMLERARRRYLSSPFDPRARELILQDLMLAYANQLLVDQLRGEGENVTDAPRQAGEEKSPQKD